jgi:hypothetical protein
MDEETKAQIKAMIQEAMASQTASQKQEPARAEEDESSIKQMTLEDRVKSLSARVKRSEELRKEEARKSREAQAFAALKSSLVGKVKQGSEDVVATLLVHGRKSLQVDETATPYLSVAGQTYGLDEGVSKYLDTDEGKLFVDAPSPGSPPAIKQAPNPQNNNQGTNQPSGLLAKFGLSLS